MLLLFPKKPVKVVGAGESFVTKGFSGGQINPDEKLRGEMSRSKPPSIGLTVVLCAKAVAGAAGWVLKE